MCYVKINLDNLVKIHRFKFKVKKHKKQLIDAGMNKWTVNSWLYHDRIPTLDNAKKIAAILNIPLTEIPYFYKERMI